MKTTNRAIIRPDEAIHDGLSDATRRRRKELYWAWKEADMERRWMVLYTPWIKDQIALFAASTPTRKAWIEVAFMLWLEHRVRFDPDRRESAPPRVRYLSQTEALQDLEPCVYFYRVRGERDSFRRFLLRALFANKGDPPFSWPDEKNSPLTRWAGYQETRDLLLRGLFS